MGTITFRKCIIWSAKTIPDYYTFLIQKATRDDFLNMIMRPYSVISSYFSLEGIT